MTNRNNQSKFLNRHRMCVASGEVCANEATQRASRDGDGGDAKVGSLALDHFGALGVPRQPLNIGRIAGVGLVLAGVLLVRRS